MFRYRKLVPVVLMLLFSMASYYAIARAGGGGGGVSTDDGGSSDSILEILWFVIAFIPFPWNLIIAAIVLVFFYVGGKRMKAKTK